MAFVTENRREEGLMMDASIRDNLTLPAIESLGGAMGLDGSDRGAGAGPAPRRCGSRRRTSRGSLCGRFRAATSRRW
jgi:hypothetical protein